MAGAVGVIGVGWGEEEDEVDERGKREGEGSEWSVLRAAESSPSCSRCPSSILDKERGPRSEERDAPGP